MNCTIGIGIYTSVYCCLMICVVDILIIGPASCTQGSIRLQGGTNTSGYVEVCHTNVWGTVCGDSDWGLTDAQVACRHLGLPSTGATTLNTFSVPNGTEVSWLRNVRCTGTESSLFFCNVLTTANNCYRSRYAGVSCIDGKSKTRNLFHVCCINQC